MEKAQFSPRQRVGQQQTLRLAQQFVSSQIKIVVPSTIERSCLSSDIKAKDMTRKLARIVKVARRSISWSTLNFFKIYYKRKFKEFAIHNVKNQTNPENCLLAEKYAIPSGNDRCPDGTTYVSIKGTQFFPRAPLQRVKGRFR